MEEEIRSLLSKLANANDTLFQYINERIEQLDTEKKQIENELIQNKAKGVFAIDPELITRALTEWEHFDFEEKKLIASAFIEKVVIYNGDIEIIYK